MSDICVLYNAEDVEDFANFFKNLFVQGSPETGVSFQAIGNIKDISDLSEFKILVLICSPCMIELFDDETETRRFQVCFTNHPCLVCLQYYVEDFEISRLQSALSIPKGWKLFTNLGSKEQCTETIGSIIEILEEQSKVPPKLPPIIKKPKHKRPSKRPVKLIPNTVHKVQCHHIHVCMLFFTKYVDLDCLRSSSICEVPVLGPLFFFLDFSHNTSCFDQLNCLKLRILEKKSTF